MVEETPGYFIQLLSISGYGEYIYIYIYIYIKLTTPLNILSP